MAQKTRHERDYRLIPGILRDLRRSAGLTQRALAERLSTSKTWVHNAEVANRRVDLAEFVVWCEACGVTPRAGFNRYLTAASSMRE